MEEEKKINISNFINEAGKITQVPVSNKTKLPVLEYMASKFEEDRIYSEKEVNGIIDTWHTFQDYFLLRRLLVDYKFLERTTNGARYWVPKKESV